MGHCPIFLLTFLNHPIPCHASGMCLCIPFKLFHSSHFVSFFQDGPFSNHQTQLSGRETHWFWTVLKKQESAFLTLFWYKLPVGKDATLQLIVNSVEGGEAEVEEELINHFQSSGTKSSCLSVETNHALLNDSGTYFCTKQIKLRHNSWSSIAKTSPCKRRSVSSTYSPVFNTKTIFCSHPPALST